MSEVMCSETQAGQMCFMSNTGANIWHEEVCKLGEHLMTCCILNLEHTPRSDGEHIEAYFQNE